MTDTTTSPRAYTIHQLGFHYGHDDVPNSETWSIRSVDFEVAQAEIVGIIGPNGSGKTSLLKLLAKLLRPNEGSIRLFDRDLTHIAQKTVARSVAFVPQESSQPFPFTIFEMVLMGRFPLLTGTTLGTWGWESKEDLHIAEQAMATMGVMSLAHRRVSDVSSGERQRVMMARALAQQPRILLLDEPTAFLDLNHQMDICTTLRRMNRKDGLTVVWVSHDLNLASQYCDRLLLLNRGNLLKIGTPAEVIQPAAIRKVYGCDVLVDSHPMIDVPRVTLPVIKNSCEGPPF